MLLLCLAHAFLSVPLYCHFHNEAIMNETKPRRAPFFLIGVVLFILGPAINVTQMMLLGQFPTPWYLPILSTVGVLLMLISTCQNRSILRGVFLVPFAALCVFEWLMLTHLTIAPAYTGPAQAGAKIPAFTASYADGTTFSDHDLAQSDLNILLFFRGRW
jgi:hypothetical protein